MHMSINKISLSFLINRLFNLIFKGSINYKVTVNVKESLFLSKKVLLKYYTSPPLNDRSYNPGWPSFPMVVKYRGRQVQMHIMLFFCI